MTKKLVLAFFLCLSCAEAFPDAVRQIADKGMNGTPVACIEDSCYASIGEALSRAENGDSVVLVPGTYRQAGVLTANNVTIVGKGAHL